MMSESVGNLSSLKFDNTVIEDVFSVSISSVFLEMMPFPFCLVEPIFENNIFVDYKVFAFNQAFKKVAIKEPIIGKPCREYVPEIVEYWINVLREAQTGKFVQLCNPTRLGELVVAFPSHCRGKNLVAIVSCDQPVKLELTPLVEKILGKYRIQLSDVVLSVVFPRLEHQRIVKLAQELPFELKERE